MIDSNLLLSTLLRFKQQTMMAHQQQQEQPTVYDEDSNIMMDTASLLLSPTSPSTSKKKYKYNNNNNTNTSNINDEDHDDNPWLYKNQRLNNLDFPIGMRCDCERVVLSFFILFL